MHNPSKKLLSHATKRRSYQKCEAEHRQQMCRVILNQNTERKNTDYTMHNKAPSNRRENPRHSEPSTYRHSKYPQSWPLIPKPCARSAKKIFLRLLRGLCLFLVLQVVQSRPHLYTLGPKASVVHTCGCVCINNIHVYIYIYIYMNTCFWGRMSTGTGTGLELSVIQLRDDRPGSHACYRQSRLHGNAG